MDEPHKETDAERRRSNIVLVVFFVLIVGAGVWLVNALMDARNADDCIARGGRNCNPVGAPPR
jgi:hypothetical protein